jgi:hypothetical protein
MLNRAALSELRAIAQRSAEAADAGGHADELVWAYEALRKRASTLARAQGWATQEQMDNQFPLTSAFREIERLDVAFGGGSGPASNYDMSARLSQTLIDLAAWATGVTLAYDALGGDAGDDV